MYDARWKTRQSQMWREGFQTPKARKSEEHERGKEAIGERIMPSGQGSRTEFDPTHSPHFFYFLFSRYRNLVCGKKLKDRIPIFDQSVIRPKTNPFNGEPYLFPPERYIKRPSTPLPCGNRHRSDEWSRTSPKYMWTIVMVVVRRSKPRMGWACLRNLHLHWLLSGQRGRSQILRVI